MDEALMPASGSYAAPAISTAEDPDIVHGAVASAQYAHQGFSGNDPTIDFKISGKTANGRSLASPVIIKRCGASALTPA